MFTISHSRLHVTKEDVEQVSRVILSGQWAQGESNQKLEEALGNFLSLPAATTLSSGTLALALTLKGMEIDEGDQVLIPSYTCTALWHAVRFAGAEPVLVDSEKDTGNMSPEKVEKALSPRVKAIILPYMFGYPARIKEFLQYGVPVIEDLAQGAGGEFEQRPLGSFGKAAVFSFYATKIIAGGEGGAVVSRDRELIAKIDDLKDYDERETLIPRINAKLSNIHATLALNHLKRIKFLISSRKKIHRLYRELLKDLPLKFPDSPPDRIPNYYRFIFYTEFPCEDLLTYLNSHGIMARKPVYKPLHLYLGLNGFPIAQHLWEHSVSLPCYPELSEDEIKKICGKIHAFFQNRI